MNLKRKTTKSICQSWTSELATNIKGHEADKKALNDKRIKVQLKERQLTDDIKYCSDEISSSNKAITNIKKMFGV